MRIKRYPAGRGKQPDGRSGRAMMNRRNITIATDTHYKYDATMTRQWGCVFTAGTTDWYGDIVWLIRLNDSTCKSARRCRAREFVFQ